jgi:CheY-like chemotaxis protein
LNNAVKFTPIGGRVEVRLDRVGAVAAAARDGHRPRHLAGVPPVRLRPLPPGRFDLDALARRAGIGLTIVRHIVELHHGSVHAESAGEGQGATFIVTLPAMVATAAGVPAVTGDSTAAAANKSAGANGTPVPAGAPTHAQRAADLSGLRVVVVDDEPDARDVIARILARAGAATASAGSVREALAEVTRQRPDVIVSDIAMPGEDGYDLIRILRETLPGETGGAAIPVLALTAYAREEDRLRCLSSGFDAHLAKPVDPAELLGVVAHLAAASPARQPELKYG